MPLITRDLLSARHDLYFEEMKGFYPKQTFAYNGFGLGEGGDFHHKC